MLINLNGSPTPVADNATPGDLVTARGLNEKTLILELNGGILQPEVWKTTRLGQNDQLEIIRIIGGG
jgi:sulfur carrier protein